MPGPWRTSRTPYLREIMNNFKCRHVRRISLCFGTQLGKSETLMNLIGYCVDEDPGSMLMVYPTDELARSISKNRIEPMIRSCPALEAKWNLTASETLELQFSGMYLALVGANSPSKLASRPVKYLLFDEVDKFPMRAGKDSSPIELASERTKTFSHRKEVLASTPTYSEGVIWQEFINSQVSKRYYVPCPHCGLMQQLELKNIKWPEDLNSSTNKQERESRVLTETWYECPACHERINDIDKLPMLSRGEWRPVKREKGPDGKYVWTEEKDPRSKPESVAYNLNSIYSPWVTFGQIAQKFLRSKDDPISFMNFMNGWLAEPWEPSSATMNSDAVMKLQRPYERTIVPKEAQILTCGVDVQLDHMWYEVRAWGPRITSWLVDYGRVETWAEIEEILDRPWRTELCQDILIQLAFLDSGYRTEEVYEFCAAHSGLAFPTKGSSSVVVKSPLLESQVEKAEWGGLKLFIVDTNYYKNFISGRIHPTSEMPERWFVYEGIHREYAEQICSEHRVKEVDSKGRVKEVWKPVTEHTPNHLLDCSVLTTAAAERMGVRYLMAEGGNG